MMTATSTIDVVVDSCYRLPKAQVPAQMAEQLGLRFTYKNPEPTPPGANGDAGQWVRPDWCAVVDDGDHYCVPRGLLEALRNCATGCGVQLRFTSQVMGDPAADRWPDDAWAVQLRPYQSEIVQVLDDRVQGYVVLPCGGGKTTAGVAAILRLGQPALVLVGSTDLMDQWCDAVDRASAGTIKARRIGGGARLDLSPLRHGEVAVAMVQALYEHTGAGTALPYEHAGAGAFLRSVAVLLTDEVHHIAARQWRWIVEQCPARWRWGLTATPDRADGWGFMLRVLLGPQLYQKTTQELVALGYLRTPSIIPVASPWAPGPAEHRWLLRCPDCQQARTYGWSAWQAGSATCAARVARRASGGKVRTEMCGALLPVDCEAKQDALDWSHTSTALGSDPTRQALLGQLAGAAVDTGRKALVLVGRKATLDPVAMAARVHGAGAVQVVASGMGAREYRIDALRTGRLDVLVATQLADEGLDVPDLDCVVMGQPGRGGGRAKQRTGRTTRPAGQPPVVFDVVDSGPVLRGQWRARRRAYEAEYGPTCIVAREPVPVDEAIRLLSEIR